VRTAPDTDEAKGFFTVTHPFHPWRGRRFELADCQRRWGQWRIYYIGRDGQIGYLPASWTDAGPTDRFVEQSQGRAMARVSDLLELAQLTASAVKEITP
jgi:hypothetical protein